MEGENAAVGLIAGFAGRCAAGTDGFCTELATVVDEAVEVAGYLWQGLVLVVHASKCSPSLIRLAVCEQPPGLVSRIESPA